jgi:CRP-like cAMP-binding protein
MRSRNSDQVVERTQAIDDRCLSSSLGEVVGIQVPRQELVRMASNGATRRSLKKGERLEAHMPKNRHQNMNSSCTPRANLILAALPASAYRRLLPHLESTTLAAGETLHRIAGPPQFAYFPTTSIVMVSHAIKEDSPIAKAWAVGREGMVGISLFLSGANRDNRADVQCSGLAFRVRARVLRDEFHRAEALQRLLLRYVFALLTEVSQLSVCNLHHSVAQRLCRFLLRAFDSVPAETIFLTHEHIALLLGVRRVSISVAAAKLQAAEIIAYERGRISLINREKLEVRACTCAEIIRRAFEAVSDSRA